MSVLGMTEVSFAEKSFPLGSHFVVFNYQKYFPFTIGRGKCFFNFMLLASTNTITLFVIFSVKKFHKNNY